MPPSYRLSCLASFTLLALFPVGCSQPPTPPSEPNRLEGTWAIDLDQTEPNLKESLLAAQEVDPSLDVEARLDAQMATLTLRTMVFTSGTIKVTQGSQSMRGTYTIVDSGDDFLTIRESYDLGEQGNGLAQLTDQQMADRFEIVDGQVPFRLGFLFLDDDHFQVFHLQVRAGQVTGHRNVSPQIFQREATPAE